MAPFIEREVYRDTQPDGYLTIDPLGNEKWLGSQETIDNVQVSVGQDQLTIDRVAPNREIFITPRSKVSIFGDVHKEASKVELSGQQLLTVDKEHQLFIFPKGHPFGHVVIWGDEQAQTSDLAYRRQFPISTRLEDLAEHLRGRDSFDKRGVYSRSGEPLTLGDTVRIVTRNFAIVGVNLLQVVAIVEFATTYPVGLIRKKLSQSPQ